MGGVVFEPLQADEQGIDLVAQVNDLFRRDDFIAAQTGDVMFLHAEAFFHILEFVAHFGEAGIHFRGQSGDIRTHDAQMFDREGSDFFGHDLSFRKIVEQNICAACGVAFSKAGGKRQLDTHATDWVPGSMLVGEVQCGRFHNRLVDRSRRCAMTGAAALKPAQQRRLAKLASEADCEAQDLLDDVFRLGIDLAEQDARETSNGLAALAAGKTVPHGQVMRETRAIIARHARKQKTPRRV